MLAPWIWGSVLSWRVDVARVNDGFIVRRGRAGFLGFLNLKVAIVSANKSIPVQSRYTDRWTNNCPEV